MSDFRLGDLIQAIDENKEAMNVQLTGSNVLNVFQDSSDDPVEIDPGMEYDTDLFFVDGFNQMRFVLVWDNAVSDEDFRVRIREIHREGAPISGIVAGVRNDVDLKLTDTRSSDRALIPATDVKLYGYQFRFEIRNNTEQTQELRTGFFTKVVR